MEKLAFAKLKYAADTWPLIRQELTITADDRRVVCENETKRIEHQCSEAEWQQLEEPTLGLQFPGMARRVLRTGAGRNALASGNPRRGRSSQEI